MEESGKLGEGGGEGTCVVGVEVMGTCKAYVVVVVVESGTLGVASRMVEVESGTLGEASRMVEVVSEPVVVESGRSKA